VRNFWIPELNEEAARYRGHPRLAEALPGYHSSTLLARRTLFETLGRFNAALRLGEDTDWFLRAAERGLVMELVSEVLVYRRLHRTNVSWRLVGVNPRERDDFLQVLKASLDRRRRQNGGAILPYQFPPSDW